MERVDELCDVCEKTKNDQPHRPEQRSIPVHRKNERFVLDVTYMEVYDGYPYIITGVDAFTKYGWAMASRKKDADSVLKFLNESLKERVFEIYHSDNGKEFINKKFEEYVEQRQAKIVMEDGTEEEIQSRQVQGRPYHPQCQGHVEKLNHTFKVTLRWTFSYFPSRSDRSLTDVFANATRTLKEIRARTGPPCWLKLLRPTTAVCTQPPATHQTL